MNKELTASIATVVHVRLTSKVIRFLRNIVDSYSIRIGITSCTDITVTAYNRYIQLYNTVYIYIYIHIYIYAYAYVIYIGTYSEILQGITN